MVQKEIEDISKKSDQGPTGCRQLQVQQLKSASGQNEGLFISLGTGLWVGGSKYTAKCLKLPPGEIKNTGLINTRKYI